MRTLLAATRRFRGITQGELATLSGISQSELSNWESGRQVPDRRRLAHLAQVLAVPAELLPLPGSEPEILHRLHRSLPARVTNRLVAELQLTGVHLDRLMNGTVGSAQIPPKLPTDPAAAARACRAKWNIPPGPIADVTSALEDHGVVCLVRDLSAAKVSAVGAWRLDARPFVLVDSDSTRYARRLSAAHELGHGIRSPQPPSDPQTEAAADAFALEFLMPRDEVEFDLRNLSLARLEGLEEQWGVPAAVIIRYARSLDVITATRHRILRAQFLDIGTNPTELAPERPSAVANVVRRRMSGGESLATIAADALLTVEQLRRDYLAGSRSS